MAAGGYEELANGGSEELAAGGSEEMAAGSDLCRLEVWTNSHSKTKSLSLTIIIKYALTYLLMPYFSLCIYSDPSPLRGSLIADSLFRGFS